MRCSCILGSGRTIRTSSGAVQQWAGGTHLWLWHGLWLWPPNVLTLGFSPSCHLVNLSEHSSNQITPISAQKLPTAPLCLQDEVQGSIAGLQSFPQAALRPYPPLGAHTNPLLIDHESTQVGAFKAFADSLILIPSPQHRDRETQHSTQINRVASC